MTFERRVTGIALRCKARLVLGEPDVSAEPGLLLQNVKAINCVVDTHYIRGVLRSPQRLDARSVLHGRLWMASALRTATPDMAARERHETRTCTWRLVC